MFPFDFDIFALSKSSQPCAVMAIGSDLIIGAVPPNRVGAASALMVLSATGTPRCVPGAMTDSL